MSETKPIHITSDYVIETVKDLAAERPGVYTRRGSDAYGVGGCVNTEVVDGVTVPSCIVGSFYARTVGIEHVPSDGTADLTLTALQDAGLITVDPEARFLLNVAQTLQDTRKIEWQVIADELWELRTAARQLVQLKINDSKA